MSDNVRKAAPGIKPINSARKTSQAKKVDYRKLLGNIMLQSVILMNKPEILQEFILAKRNLGSIFPDAPRDMLANFCFDRALDTAGICVYFLW